jgi:hypothetical protein
MVSKSAPPSISLTNSFVLQNSHQNYGVLEIKLLTELVQKESECTTKRCEFQFLLDPGA